MSSLFSVFSPSPAAATPVLSVGEVKSITPPTRSLEETRPIPLKMLLSAPSKVTSLPPRLDLTPRVTHTFRFIATAGASHSYTVGNVLGALGTVGYNSTTTSSFCSSFKIEKVTVWPSVSAAGAGATLSWTAGTAGQAPDELIDRSFPTGVTMTGAVLFVPPPQSLCGYWIDNALSSTTTLWTMTLTAGSVVDLRVHYTNVGAMSGPVFTVASASPGSVYYLALDGPSSNNLVPVALPTTH